MQKPEYKDSEILFSSSWIQVIGKDDRQFMVRRRCSGVAIIIAINSDRELVLTEQYRVPVGASVLELPAGMSGDEPGKENETELTAAKRELLEETGYEAQEMREVAKGPISPGISNEIMTFFYTDKVVKRHEGGGDETENITVHTVPLSKIDEYLKEQEKEGLLIDPKIYIGINFVRSLFENK